MTELMKAYNKAKEYGSGRTYDESDDTKLARDNAERVKLYEEFATLALRELEEKDRIIQDLIQDDIENKIAIENCELEIAHFEDIIKRAKALVKPVIGAYAPRATGVYEILSEADQTNKTEEHNG